MADCPEPDCASVNRCLNQASCESWRRDSGSPYPTWCRGCDANIPPYAQHECPPGFLAVIKSRFNDAVRWREYVRRDESERRIDSAFKEAERYRELSLLEAARADRAEAKLAALVGAGGPSSGAMESRHDSATRAASTTLTYCEHGYARDDAAHPAAGLERCGDCEADRA